MRKVLTPCHWKRKYNCEPKHCPPKCLPDQHLRAEEKISKIAWIPLEKQDFSWQLGTCWKWQNFKCCQCAKFSPCHCNSRIHAHLGAIHTNAHPQTSSSGGKDFENRLNIFGHIGFLLAQCAGWKWQTFKCCRYAKFSHCYCKSKITANPEHTIQMPTLNIIELRQRFWKSVEYLRRYRIFAGTVYRLKVAKISNVVDA